MTILEQNGSIFDTPKDYVIINFITRDCHMDTEISKKFPNLKQDCSNKIEYFKNFEYNMVIHNASRTICNLIIKDNALQKSSYDDIKKAFIHLQLKIKQHYVNSKIVLSKNIKEFDEIQWETIDTIIRKVFKKTKVEILIKTND